MDIQKDVSFKNVMTAIRGGGMYMYNGNGGSTDDEWFAGRVCTVLIGVFVQPVPSGVGQDTAMVYNKFNISKMVITTQRFQCSDERIKQDIVAETDQLANVLALKNQNIPSLRT